MDDAQLARRFAVIERQLKLISDRLTIDCPPFVSDELPPPAGAVAGAGESGASVQASSGLPPEVLDLARAGHSTQAISLLRRLTGASLVEAKRAIDAL